MVAATLISEQSAPGQERVNSSLPSPLSGQLDPIHQNFDPFLSKSQSVSRPEQSEESEVCLRRNRKQNQRHGLLGEPPAGQPGKCLDRTEVARYLSHSKYKACFTWVIFVTDIGDPLFCIYYFFGGGSLK